MQTIYYSDCFTSVWPVFICHKNLFLDIYRQLSYFHLATFGSDENMNDFDFELV